MCNFPSDLQVESLSKYSSTSTFLFFSLFFFYVLYNFPPLDAAALKLKCHFVYPFQLLRGHCQTLR